MRRITLRLAAASLTFAIGSISVWFPQLVPQLNLLSGKSEADSLLAAPSDAVAYERAEYYPDARTTDDFKQFWAEFKAAVRRDDKKALYALTTHNDFTWHPKSLKLHYKTREGYYAIRSYEEFAQSYPDIFPSALKQAILTKKPEKPDPRLDYYTLLWTEKLSWVEKKERSNWTCLLMLTRNSESGYKLDGALVESLR